MIKRSYTRHGAKNQCTAVKRIAHQRAFKSKEKYPTTKMAEYKNKTEIREAFKKFTKENEALASKYGFATITILSSQTNQVSYFLMDP